MTGGQVLDGDSLDILSTGSEDRGRSLMVSGAPVETTGNLMQSQFLIGILYPQSLISPPEFPAPRGSPSWTCRRGTIRFLWEIRILSRLLLLLLLACSSSCFSLLALGAQLKRSREWWIIYLVTLPFVLFTWMIFSSNIQIWFLIEMTFNKSFSSELLVSVGR